MEGAAANAQSVSQAHGLAELVGAGLQRLAAGQLLAKDCGRLFVPIHSSRKGHPQAAIE
jgi:hypothetical protein